MNDSPKNHKKSSKRVLSSAPIIEVGLALHQQGQLELAREIYKTIKESDPSYPESLHLIGVTNLQQSKYDAALEYIKKSITLQPKNPQALNNLANTHIKLENFSLALEAYQNAIDIEPNFTEAYFNKANLLKQLKKVDEALVFYDQSLYISPTFTEAHINKGNLLKEIEQPNEAIECYIKAISIQPNLAQPYYNIGLILNTLKRYEDAIKYFYEAIKISPKFVEAYCNLSISLCENNQLTDAIDAASKAISLNPKHPEAYNNRGIAYGKMNQHIKAIDDFQCSLKINPIKPETHFNLGNTYRELKQIDKSLENYEAAIKLNPNYAEAYWNMACLNLLNGDYGAGWKLYEWRWKWDGFPSKNRNFSEPIWTGGESLAGKTILIHSEQGLGDCIQFSTYIEEIEGLGAKVLFEVYPQLYTLFRNKWGQSKLIIKGCQLPQFDYHCPLLSLPLALKSISPKISNPSRYFMQNPKKNKYWNERLGKKNKTRVGVVWCGSHLHKNDLNRSISLEKFIPFLSNNFEFICLQKEIRIDDLELLKKTNILDISEEINDFEDTAAVCDLVDLIITVDTSVAHLSCAVGRPTWILLPFIPDWRWGLEGETSEWYPSAKLYRQTEDRNWDTVITKVAQDLAQFVATPSPTT